LKTLLLLHGALADKEQLHALMNFLKDDFSVHAISFSGHGKSLLKHDAFSMENFCNDIIDYIKSHELKHVNIFGYSMGGYAALYCARHQPGMIESIFTLATKFNWTQESATAEVKMLQPEMMEQKIPAFVETLKQRHGVEHWKDVVSQTASMMMEMGRKNPLADEDFKMIRIPVMLTRGDQDKMVSETETFHVHQLITGSQLVTLAETPHPFEKVNVSALAVMLRNFFSRKD
jgi:pimeloyl-ACP methyl ester carboxylesterase